MRLLSVVVAADVIVAVAAVVAAVAAASAAFCSYLSDCKPERTRAGGGEGGREGGRRASGWGEEEA